MAGLTCDDARDLAASYVLGALELAEARAVAEHLATCPEAHDEFAALGGVLPYLAETVELVEPPAALRSRILAAAALELATRGGAESGVASPGSADLPARPLVGRTPMEPTAAPDVRADVGAPEPITQLHGESTLRVVPAGPVSTAPVPLRSSRRVPVGPGWLIGIAAVLAIALLGAWNIALQRDLSHAQAYQARVTKVLALAGMPGARIAILTDGTQGPAGQPNGLAVVSSEQPGRLVVTGLAATTGIQAYEAWAIVDGQAPVPIGSFTVGSDGVGYFAQLPLAPPISLTVAVTLEPAASMTAPTGPIVSSGVVRAE